MYAIVMTQFKVLFSYYCTLVVCPTTAL